ncbi:MAG: DUF3604 domain-containing protein, partial [Pseudomonadota bacterium]
MNCLHFTVTRYICMFTFSTMLTACSDQEPAQPAEQTPTPTEVVQEKTTEIKRNPNRNAYFGDLHVHTKYSLDAFLFGTRNTPDDAYQFAKGGALEHASGFKMQLKKPLDFQGVSDHALYLGVMPAIADENDPYANHPLSEAFRGTTSSEGANAGFQALGAYSQSLQASDGENDLDNREVVRSAWAEIIASAERHNDPGIFTTFIAYEYTSAGPASENLHRNVVYRGSSAPATPFGRLDSTNPQDLWNWMDEQRANGMDALAIPHNPNGSDGWMFPKTNWTGEPIDAAYAEQRMRNEPIVEVTQVKGTSDTHPLLSPNDEWADFEIMPLRVAISAILESQPQGSYVREAYLNGLVMEETGGFNPYRFGVIGSSDTHNAAGSFDEDNYWSKTGMLDIDPKSRGSVPLDEPGEDGEPYANGASKYWGASGLAGVWAESNTRADIFDAMRRKETFATSGPHIKVRFFAGYDLNESMLTAGDDVARAYDAGVPMGGDLLAKAEEVPTFLAWALRDADSGSLQRLQIVKGWVEDGKANEQVFDIACSDGGEVSPDTHRCPDNGATVNLADCSVTPDKGASELRTAWRDPGFTPGQRAFY